MPENRYSGHSENEPRVTMNFFRVGIVLCGTFIAACNVNPEDQDPIPGPKDETVAEFRFFPAHSIKEWKYRDSREPAEERVVKVIDVHGTAIRAEYIRDIPSASVHSDAMVYFRYAGDTLLVDSLKQKFDRAYLEGLGLTDTGFVRYPGDAPKTVLYAGDTSLDCGVSTIFGESMSLSGCDSGVEVERNGDTLTLTEVTTWNYKFNHERTIVVTYLSGIGMTGYSLINTITGCWMGSCGSGVPDTSHMSLYAYTDKDGREIQYRP
jgi:hypothetical protein